MSTLPSVSKIYQVLVFSHCACFAKQTTQSSFLCLFCYFFPCLNRNKVGLSIGKCVHDSLDLFISIKTYKHDYNADEIVS